MADVQIDKLTIEIEANSGAATTNIKKLGKAIESLSSTGSLKTVIDSLEKLNEKLSNMSNLSSAVSGINKVSDAMKKATGVSNNMTAQTEALGSSLKNLFSQAVVIAIIQKANTLLESAITNYSKYTEDINLFAVAMGNAADSGGRFAQRWKTCLALTAVKLCGIWLFSRTLQPALAWHPIKPTFLARTSHSLAMIWLPSSI